MAWWERKLQKGQECSHTDMTPTDWLQLELLRNVYNSELQRKLLEVREPTLEELLKIATLWQQADSAQVAIGKEASEDVRRIPTEQNTQDTRPPQEEEDRCSDDINVCRLSDYKKEGKLKWNNQQNNIRPPARQSPPNQCGGCGAQGEKMQPRDSCPARSLVCFLCGKTGHYKSVCRSQQRSQNPPGMYNDVQRQPYYRPPTSYQPPPSYSASQKMVRVNNAKGKLTLHE